MKNYGLFELIVIDRIVLILLRYLLILVELVEIWVLVWIWVYVWMGFFGFYERII